MTTAHSGHNTVMPKQSNREKLVQEPLNHKKNYQKTDDIIWEKNDVRNDKKRRKNDQNRRFHLKNKRRKKPEKDDEEPIISYT